MPKTDCPTNIVDALKACYTCLSNNSKGNLVIFTYTL